ncbi:MAG: (2Fe-2S)-binding protein [Gemmatimonadetes bacterium]|nr:(2Fe-2S)-binding protein [Gemmatimonadota bacterium]
MSAAVSLEMAVNGSSIDARVDARTTLADFIRDGCGLIGTKLGCEHGVCGSCTVLVDDLPVRSCLMLAASAHGSSVRTVESLAGDELSDLQDSFRDHHALQCGFCTPGLLMTAQALLESSGKEAVDVREAVSGHICRCTGYEPIINAIEAAVRLRQEPAP